MESEGDDLSRPLTRADLVTIEGEARVLDLRLADALGFKAPREIRRLIKRYLRQLGAVGTLCHRATKSASGMGRPGFEYWLNRAQTGFVITRSETPRALAATLEILSIWEAYEAGELVPASSVALVPATPTADAILDRLDRFEGKLDRHGAQLDRVERYLNDGRRSFSAESKRQFLCVVATRYDGKCPACELTKIVDEAGQVLPGAEADHFVGRTFCEARHGWLVCRGCNARLATDARFRQIVAPHFEVFQHRRAAIFDPPLLPLFDS